jgi:hypothetical protein
LGDDPERPERRDERKRERDAAEVGGDAGKGGERCANPLRRAVTDRRVGDEQSERRAERRRDEADLDAGLERIDVGVLEEQLDVGERRVVVRVLERADEDRCGRREQERDRVREERNRREPGERQAPPAGLDVRPERLRCSVGCDG